MILTDKNGRLVAVLVTADALQSRGWIEEFIGELDLAEAERRLDDPTERSVQYNGSCRRLSGRRESIPHRFRGSSDQRGRNRGSDRTAEPPLPPILFGLILFRPPFVQHTITR